MKWDRIIGGLAIVGTLVLAVLAVIGDNSTSAEPEVITAPPAETFAPQPDTTAPDSAADTSAVPTSPGETSSSTAPAPEPDATADEQPDTAPDTESTVPRSDIDVRVVNAGALQGAAGDASDLLRDGGFSVQTPGDRDPVPFTFILHSTAPGNAAGAVEVALLLGIDPVAVVPLDSQPEWETSAAADTDVLVILGSDRQ